MSHLLLYFLCCFWNRNENKGFLSPCQVNVAIHIHCIFLKKDNSAVLLCHFCAGVEYPPGVYCLHIL